MRYAVLAILLAGCTTPPPRASLSAPPNNAVTWKYIYAMPTSNIKFEVWQSKNLSSWSLKTTVTQPPVNVGNANNMYFRVRACNGSNCSDWGLSNNTPPPPPAYPKSLTVTWVASITPGVNDYKVYRGTNSGNYTSAFDVGKVATSFADSTVVPGLPYYYVASALIGSQESTRSNEGLFTPTNAPAPPYAVQVIRQ